MNVVAGQTRIVSGRQCRINLRHKSERRKLFSFDEYIKYFILITLIIQSLNCKESQCTDLEGNVTESAPKLTGDLNYTPVAITNHNCSCVNKKCICNQERFIDIPQNMDSKLQSLDISEGDLQRLTSTSLDAYRNTIVSLSLAHLPHFTSIDSGALRNLPQLKTIYVSYAPSLRFIAPDVFRDDLPQLRVVRFHATALQHIPPFDITSLAIMETLDFSGSSIVQLFSSAFRVSSSDLILEDNQIMEIGSHAFNGSKLGRLILRRNRKLCRLHENVFVGLQELKELDLSDTGITFLPTAGLKNLSLEILRLERTESLHVFPSVFYFRSLINVELTYHYHCCAFRFPHLHSPQAFLEDEREYNSCSSKTANRQRRHAMGSFGGIIDYQLSNDSSSKDEETVATSVFHNKTVDPQDSIVTCGRLVPTLLQIKCKPEPDAFNPCEDVMGYVGLRVGVWIVVVAAVAGNAAVMVVLMSTRFKMTVSKFLMCNLAFADFCMGIYLFMLAAMDLHTIGQYFNYAILWQTGAGCKVAGFLTVFGSELSIFTLTVITLERWYAITYAIHLNKRLRLGTAVKVMIFGWIYAITYATLPLVGISGYSKTSICLPFDISHPLDMAYILSLLAINGLAFLLICACYAKMYCTISAHHSTVTQSDKTVAKRMALLVFTDFACWAPIAFFGLTAVFGHPLIDVTNSKILLVFFYPLNSCANPFLYAIFTKQYRRDLMILLNRYGLIKERSSGTKSNFNKHVGSFSVTNVTNNAICLRNRTCIGDVITGGSGTTTTGQTRRASLITQLSTVIDKHLEKNYEEISLQIAMSSADNDGVSDDDSREMKRIRPASAADVSPKQKGSPHPIKNNYAKLMLASNANIKGSRNLSPLEMDLKGRWECWNVRRSASLGGCVQDIIPLQQQSAVEHTGTCKSAF
ncbi:hypothetical protein CHUAL_004404 [Chamberlinius hualienensis]